MFENKQSFKEEYARRLLETYGGVEHTIKPFLNKEL